MRRRRDQKEQLFSIFFYPPPSPLFFFSFCVFIVGVYDGSNGSPHTHPNSLDAPSRMSSSLKGLFINLFSLSLFLVFLSCYSFVAVVFLCDSLRISFLLLLLLFLWTPPLSCCAWASWIFLLIASFLPSFPSGVVRSNVRFLLFFFCVASTLYT